MKSSIEKAIERTSLTSQADTTVELFPGLETNQQSQQKVPHAQKGQLQIEFDLEALAQDGYLTPETMQGNLAEEYRLLKHTLFPKTHEAYNTGRSTKLIAVTSATVGEGKTFTAFNLAMSLSIERNSSVYLFDGDVIGRSLTQMVGLDAENGLIDALLDNSSSAGIVYSSNIPNLKLIPAGRPHQHATELMRGKYIRQLVHSLASYTDDQIVVFDTPPLLGTALTVTMMDLVDQILVVAEEGRTPLKLITRALSLLDKDKSINIVLNKCAIKKEHYYR